MSMFSILEKADLGPSIFPDHLSDYFLFKTNNVIVNAFNRVNISNSERSIIKIYLDYYHETS